MTESGFDPLNKTDHWFEAPEDREAYERENGNMSGWKPFESAPRDRPVDLWYRAKSGDFEERLPDCRWSVNSGCWVDGNGFLMREEVAAGLITHWRERPAPPEPEEPAEPVNMPKRDWLPEFEDTDHG